MVMEEIYCCFDNFAWLHCFEHFPILGEEGDDEDDGIDAEDGDDEEEGIHLSNQTVQKNNRKPYVQK